MAVDGMARKRNNLRDRIVVGVILAALAALAIWFGAWSFVLLVAAAVLLAFREWAAMTAVRRPWYSVALVVLAAITLLAGMDRPGQALLLLCAAIAILSLASRNIWLGAGLSWAGLPAIALIWMRAEPHGLWLVLWTMALVWATDIFAYFSGRAVGGPKIWPAISPSKTWAGLMGGMAAAAAFSVFFARQTGWGDPLWLVALAAAGLAIVAQAGDFFESWLKRRAGVKDSGNLLPGHGGVMDRIDGLVPVAIVVATGVALA